MKDSWIGWESGFMWKSPILSVLNTGWVFKFLRSELYGSKQNGTHNSKWA